LDKHIAEFEKKKGSKCVCRATSPARSLPGQGQKAELDQESLCNTFLHAEYYCQTLKGPPLRPMQAQQQDKKFLPFDLIYSGVWAASFIFPLESGKE
jgi:hypothetical protein